MRIFFSSKEAEGKIKRPVLALGNFDGVHLAHQKMFALTRDLAKKTKGTPGVYTFEPHPVKVLSPENSPPLITTPGQKIDEIKKCRIKALIIEPFSRNFAKLNPEEFFETILVKRLRTAGLVAGYDFTFGAKRSGTVETLEKLCDRFQIAYRILEATLLGDTLVSSTQIRNMIRSGEMEKAAGLLGRPFEIVGTVIRGLKIGRALHFPTANLLVENEILPLPGVYATRALLGFREIPSVTNIGYRPTFGGRRLTVETHLIRFRKQIYGRKLRVKFIRRIREEMSFPTPQDLARQIQKDVEAAKKIL